MIEEVFEMRKNNSRFAEEKGRILALGILRLVLFPNLTKIISLELGILGLVLFPNLTKIISLEVVVAFIAYKNTQINSTEAILVETISTLNHCRRVSKGSMRCYEQLLYIWLIIHIKLRGQYLTSSCGLVKNH
jgi:hypothetical protein